MLKLVSVAATIDSCETSLKKSQFGYTTRPARCSLPVIDLKHFKLQPRFMNWRLKFSRILTEVTQDDPGIAMTFQVGPVLEEPGNGEVRTYVFVALRATSLSFASAHATLTVGRGPSLSDADRKRIEEEQKELEYLNKRRKATTRFVSAFVDERALRVQRLLRNELTTQSMWHIFELIEDDMGGAMKDLVSHNRQTRFERSINHPLAFGQQARHVISKVEPPPKPMSLDEARSFVEDLAARWLEIKASLPPSA